MQLFSTSEIYLLQEVLALREFCVHDNSHKTRTYCTYPSLVDDAGVDRRLLVGVVIVFDVVFLTAL